MLRNPLKTGLGCSSVQFSSVIQSCPTLCNPMDSSTPGFPVPHQLPELAQTHPWSWWYHTTISSSVVPFSSCLQSFPASGSFPMSQLFASGGQNIGVSASASVLPMNIQDWFLLGLTGLISLQSKGFSRVFSINSLTFSFLYNSTLTTYMTTGKTIALTRWTFVDKVMFLFLNMLSSLVITFLPRKLLINN